MNFEYLLYRYLLKHQTAEVPGFGVFKLTKQSAKIDAENSVILPPKESIEFEQDYFVSGLDLADYISLEKGFEQAEVLSQLKNQSDQWKHKLQSEGFLQLGNIGRLILDKENRIIKDNEDTDAFGFEEINLNQLKTKKSIQKSDIEYKLNKGVVWSFVSLIVTGSVLFYFFGDQELIFGKSSNIPAKQTVKKIEKPKILVVPKQDSIKKDSIKSTINAKIQKTSR